MNGVDLDRSVGYALKRATTAVRAAMDDALRRHGLTVAQYACLELLAQEPALSNAELARGAFVSRQAMHQLLTGLRSNGLVQLTGQGKQGRLSLTPAGRERLRGAAATVAGVEERMLAGLDPPERRRLHAALVACAEALGPGRELSG